MVKTQKSLMLSIISLILCFSMLLGSTYAWFTDMVTSDKNQIVTGTLDVELEYLNAKGEWSSVEGKTDLFDPKSKWEPGHTEVVYLRVRNLGSLALKYRLGLSIVDETGSINVHDEKFKLSDYIRFGAVGGVETPFADGASALGAVTDEKSLREGYTKEGALKAGDPDQYVALVVYMPETVGDEANHKFGYDAPKIELGVNLVATQAAVESDSFGSDYDKDAIFPELDLPIGITVPVTPTADGKVPEGGITIQSDDGAVSAIIPAGTQLKPGVTSLTLNVTEIYDSKANITIEEGEVMRAADVHVEGVADNNTVPIPVYIAKCLTPGLNIGNYRFYHVEYGQTSEMTLITDTANPKHNEFTYDPATGDVTVYLASFSEVAVVAEPAKWEGGFDYSWYDASKTKLTIANADQLAAFGAIVGGMAKKDGDGKLYTSTGIDKNATIVQDSFDGKTVKLIADINLGDAEANNVEGKIFYPIGYWNYEECYEKDTNKQPDADYYSGFYAFEGTFDGNGNTIKNWYQNTWEMKGDHDWYDANLRYFRDGMGLFGKVYGGTVKNLIVDNFSCDSEIGTTGVIAAYADSKDGQPAVFENITITNCKPRVYNIGNGGIVGCAGWYSRNESLGNTDYTNAVTFRNITVDQTNKISALWGSWGVSCAGILGQYYPNSACGIKMENCHVAAIIDVNNDVCSNYQYYWYRYAGMFIGTIRANKTDDNGYTIADTTGVFAKDCTYTMGNWNEYWYCEIVANSLASYTHDHQFSRLDNITDISEIQNADGTWKKEGHFALLSTDRKSVECYHIFKDSNGKLYQHFHDKADESNPNIYESFDLNGDGELNDLKEDRQRYFIPFNQLLTGLDMGIKAHTEFEGIKFVENGTVASVKKFDSTSVTSIKVKDTVALGDLFKSGVDASVISMPTVQVYVSPVGDDSTASATYSQNVNDWKNSTLTFSGAGTAKIVITDYYYCTSTTMYVTVGDEASFYYKFETKFTGEFLYRVGNQNEVKLDSLFKAVDGVNIGDVQLTVDAIDGTGASGTYTPNATWTNGTIQFSGTGVVKVTITDGGYCKPTILYLEVVDAVNATGAMSATANNVVLLNDISSGFTVSNGYAFYGNGFKVTCSGKGTYLNNGGMTLGYVNVQTGGILDNVQVICDIYPNAFIYAEEVKVSNNLDKEASTSDKSRYMYQLSAISVSGNGSVVSNCYAYGGRNNIYVGGGNVTIENTVTECGTLANIQIAGVKDTAINTITLKDVTTIQYKNTSTYDSTKIMLGLGIMVGDNESTKNPNIILQGDLKQYNWVTNDDTSVSNTYAKTAIEGALKVTEYQHTINGKTTVNMGIAYLNAKTTDFLADNDQRTSKQEIPYMIKSVTISGQTGYVYSIAGNSIDGTNRYNAAADGITPYKPSAQRDVVPKPTFSLGNQAVNGEDRYLVGDINGITARYESGQDALTLDITKLMTASKYGSDLKVNSICIDPDGNTLNGTVTLSKSGVYTLKFTVVDAIFYYLEGEKVVSVDKTIEYTYTVSINLTIAEPSIQDATLKVGTDSYKGEYTDKTTDGSKKLSINPLTPLTVTEAGAEFNLKKNVNRVDISYSATGTDGNGNAFGGTTTITITYTEGQVLKIVLAKPNSNSPGNPKSITYDSDSGTVKSSNTLAKKSCTEASWTVSSYSFTGKNGKTITSTGVTFKIAADTSGGCVTPDTLVTLADGSQKRIDEVTYEDQLLVWNFYTGKYDVAPAAIIFDHGYDNNTVIALKFSDGTVVKAVNIHQFFNADLNEFVTITEDTVAQYVGHEFVKMAGDGYTTVTLTEYTVSYEYVEAFGIISALHYNIIVEGMFSADFEEKDFDLFNYFVVGENMTFDQNAMQEDIEKYGLYTYDEFADYLTYEQFMAFNVQYMKIAVGKGTYTYEGILALIDFYLNQ